MNNASEKKISDFTDLTVWQEAHELVLQVYKLTKLFPKSETFSLVNQMQRCAVSITSNIAEGFARRTKNEKLQFYYISLGSLAELRNQILVCRDLKYISFEQSRNLHDHAIKVRMLLNGLIKTSTNYIKQ